MIERELRKQPLNHPQPGFGGSARRRDVQRTSDQSSTFQPVPSFLVSNWDAGSSYIRGHSAKAFHFCPDAHLERLPPISHMRAASLALLTLTREGENKTWLRFLTYGPPAPLPPLNVRFQPLW